MRRIHLLRVADDPGAFAPLLRAAAAAGLRAGWLELGEPDPPPALERAAAAGALRAVAAGPRRTLSVKHRSGEVPLQDLLREQFLGCRFVLVVGGPAELPRLAPDGDDWRVVTAGHERRLTTSGLLSALRGARPFGADRSG